MSEPPSYNELMLLRNLQTVRKELDDYRKLNWILTGKLYILGLLRMYLNSIL